MASTSPAASLRELVPESLRPFVLLSYPIRPTSLANLSAHPPRREWAAAFHSPYTTRHRSSWSALANLGGASLSIADSPASVHSYSYPNATSSSSSSGSGSYRTSLPGSSSNSSSGTLRMLYGAGPADAAFVLFCALALTVLRHVMMKYVFGAFARQYLEKRDRRLVSERQAIIRGKRKLAAGHTGAGAGAGIPPKPMGRRKREYAVTRFSEQGWAAAYPLCTWIFGVVSVP